MPSKNNECALAKIIDKACAFESKDRYASAADLHAALTDARLELIDNPPDTILRHSDFHLHAIPAPTPLPADLMETLAESEASPFRYNHRGLVAAAIVFALTAGGYLAFSWATSGPTASKAAPATELSQPAASLPEPESTHVLSGVAPDRTDDSAESRSGTKPGEANAGAAPNADTAVRPTQLPKAPKTTQPPRTGSPSSPTRRSSTAQSADTKSLTEPAPPRSTSKPSRETAKASAKRNESSGKSATGRDLGY